ncbi:MAG TPA: hypothetical protein VFG21_05320 [Xanthomonadaceae bacterium]|nr:hypothetical protein [Xanthomonadaceae bacterium]
MSPDAKSSVTPVRRWLPTLALWVGIAAAVATLIVYRAELHEASAAVSALQWVLALALLLARWLLLVASWHWLLRGFAPGAGGWRASLRQTGYLLAGKYVPGKVFGILARGVDSAAAGHVRQAWTASVLDQILTFAAAVLVGLVLWASAASGQARWLLALPLVIPVLVLSIPLALGAARRLAGLMPRATRWLTPAVAAPGARRNLLAAAGCQVAQTLLVALLIMVLAPHDRIGLAGAYLVSLAGGMALLVLPGGIGAREGLFVSIAAGTLGTTAAVLLAALLRLLLTLGDLIAGLVAMWPRIVRD